MAPQKAAGDHISIRKRRARYRAWHRGTREMDLILGPFADAHADAMDEAELSRFETLLEEPDPQLLSWIIGEQPVPASADTELLSRLTVFSTSR